MGRSYVIEHCISALNSYNEEKITINYIANALKFIVHNTGRQENVLLLEKSLYDILEPKQETEKDIADANEASKKIIDRMKNLLGGK